ncbi:DnaB-like helicase C-terminal domain-containing protein [soil metagenome]
MELLKDDFDFDQYFRNDQQNVDPAKIKPASAWLDQVIDRFHGDTTASSWKSLGFDKMRGLFDLRPGEVTLWTGVNGHGKTTFLSHAILNVMHGGSRACLASLEMTPATTMAKMSRQAAAVEIPAERYLRGFHQWTDGRMWIYDHVGTVAPGRMLAIATYVRKELGIDHMVIDSLMKCGIGNDDYNGQKAFVDGLCAIARDTGLHIHLVAHMRKGETEHKPADKFDVKGAGDITDLIDNLVIVWKDQRKHEQVDEAQRDPDPAARDAKLADLRKKPDAIVRIAKQRHYEFEGKFLFWFDKASQLYLENSFERPRWIDVEPQSADDWAGDGQ